MDVSNAHSWNLWRNNTGTLLTRTIRAMSSMMESSVRETLRPNSTEVIGCHAFARCSIHLREKPGCQERGWERLGYLTRRLVGTESDEVARGRSVRRLLEESLWSADRLLVTQRTALGPTGTVGYDEETKCFHVPEGEDSAALL